MLKARANQSSMQRHKLSETLLETIDNYEIERLDEPIAEVVLNETSD